jgi:D-aspartate ligase
MSMPATSASAPRKGAIVFGGAHGSLEIARSLGRRNIPVWLITADNPLATLSRYVERSLFWGGPRQEGSVAFLIDLARRHGLGGWLLFAGGDEDVRFIAHNHSALGAVFDLTTPQWNTIQWAYDKRNMNMRAAELGIAHPSTFYPRTREELAKRELRFPVVLKPTIHEGRNAFDNAKVWRADDRDTLLARYEKAASMVGPDRIMVQDLIPGDGRTQFSYAAVWDRGAPVGSLVARRRRQYPVEFGYTSTFVETTELPEVEDAACRFLRSIDYSGLVEIEFKFDARDGRFKILDVNARAWAWIALGAAVGLDFPALQWRLAQGERIAPMSARSGAHWLYFSRDLVASGREMIAGTLSPAEYLRSWRRSDAGAVFCWDDPIPAIFDLPLVLARVAKRRLFRSYRHAVPARRRATLAADEAMT